MKYKDEVLRLQTKLINVALLGAIIMIFPALFTSMIRMVDIGWNPIFFVHISITLVLILMHLFRNRMALSIRIHGLLILAMSASLLGIFSFRTAGGGYYMSVAMVLSALFFGARSGLLYLIIYVIGFSLIFTMHKLAWYTPSIDFNTYLNNTTTWISNFFGHIYVSLVLIYTANLFYKYFTGSIQSLTEKTDQLNQAIQKLQFSEERFRIFMENYPFPISIKDQNSNYVFVNKALTDLMGKTKEELLTLREIDIFPESVAKQFLQTDEQIKKQKEFIEFDLETEMPDGSPLHFQIIKFPLTDTQGKTLIGAITINQTEKRKAEKNLEISEEKYRMLFEASLDGFIFFDSEMRIRECNKSLCSMLGYTHDQLRKKKYIELFTGQAHKLESELFKRAKKQKSGNTGIFEKELQHANDYGIPVELNLHWLQLEDQTFYWAVIRNISERKLMERELYRIMIGSEEQERERYARELHDGLGPLLSTCKIYFHTLDKLKDEDKRQEHMRRTGELLNEAMQSIKEISNNLSPDILRKYGLKHALESFSTKVKIVSETNIFIESNIEDRLSETIEFTIYRMLVELINNSLKYSEAREIHIRLHKEKGLLSVSYRDNGKGFDYESAKSKRQGFGLFNLENRINRLGGEYHYTSSPGKGVQAEFTINSSQ